MTRPSHVFVVGLARTGTTLMYHILNSSEEVGISGSESHFFGSSRVLGLMKRENFRDQLDKIGDISTNEGVCNILDFLGSYNGPRHKFWGSLKNANQEKLLSQTLATKDRYRFLWELAMELGANGKPIWGDKTPAHVFYIPQLIEWFPEAKFIHMFRDPRATYMSNKKKYDKRTNLPSYNAVLRRTLMFQFYLSLDEAVAWRRVIQCHRQYQRCYPDNYRLCRYEDLVYDPIKTLQQVCDFLEITFKESMLEQTVSNSSFLPREKNERVRGIDTSTVSRWREYIHPAVNKWMTFWCKKQLVEFGYQL